MDTFRDLIKKKYVIFDGGMGSLLQAEGLQAGELPELWNITHAEVLRRIHRDYLDAGADIVTTNTFGANPFKYPLTATEENPYTLSDVVTAALSNARSAAEEKDHGFVALDLGPTGKLLEPMGDLSFEACVDAYKEVVTIAKDKADLILIETMSDLYELKAAVLAAKEAADLPVVATVAFDATGKLLTGGTPRSVVALLEGLRVDALGLNCGLGPADMAPFAKELLAYASVPVIVQPNAGLPRVEGGRTVYDLGAADFAEEMRDIVALGARLVGGCCGTTPAHIAALRDIVDAPRPADEWIPRSAFDAAETKPSGSSERLVSLSAAETFDAVAGAKRNTTLVTGFADAVEIGDDPVIIGERINPTGKKRFQQALREADMEYILNVGLSEQEQGAQILDVNVGLPEIDEPEMMVKVVRELQSVTELPLQLDTSDPEALSRAMRIYNGKPLINSVNGKKEVMDLVFPLVQKYGGVVVCLCLDEDGIPDTPEGRVAIAKKIIDEAATYGIQKKDLLVDALCMTISSEERGAIVTLETVRRLREELDVRTVLGVSNISFGLPMREFVNATFYTMALERGLNAGIINPGAEDMMRAYRSFRALRAFDAHCMAYIEAYANYFHTSTAPASALCTSATLSGAGHSVEPDGLNSMTPNALCGSHIAASRGASPEIDAVSSGDGVNAPRSADKWIPRSAFDAAETKPQGSSERLASLSAAETFDAETGAKRTSELYLAIKKGLKDQALAAAKQALETTDALAIINDDMMPALDDVGQGFENGTVFLPQLIMSAEAAKAAFDVIRTKMNESGDAGAKRGRVVIATVKGDIHDIGKNIVKVLLENYNFDVIDLGKDVAPETIVDTAIREHAPLVGLSALMTTTVPAMEETIRLLREKAPDVKVMVGGAVMTKNYAEKIGADHYSKDAMGAVTYAEEVAGA